MYSTRVDLMLSFLNCLEQDENVLFRDLKILQIDLRFIQTFLRCAMKFSNCSCVASFLDKMEHAVHKFEQDIVNLGDVTIKDAYVEGNLLVMVPRFEDNEADFHSRVFECAVERMISNFREDTKFLEQEMNDVYIFLSDCYSQSGPPTVDEVLVFIGSVLENLSYIHRVEIAYGEDRDLSEALEEKLMFLQNFILFVASQGVKQEDVEDLLIHTQALAVNAGRVSCNWRKSSKICPQFRELLQKIKPVEPQVRQIYIRVLRASKLSGLSHHIILDDYKNIAGDFIDSLLGNLWELLEQSKSNTVSVNNQMLVLYEGLRFLRTILKQPQQLRQQQHDKFDTLDATMNILNIGATVSGAGIVVCSLFANKMKERSAKDIDRKLFDFLETIKLIKAKLRETHPVKSRYRNVLGFIDFLLDNLKELLSRELDSIASAKDQIQIIQEDLVLFRSFLRDMVEQRNNHGELQGLYRRIIEVAYNVEFVVDSFVVRDSPNRTPILFNTITEEIKLIKSEVLEIDINKYCPEAREVAKMSSHVPSHGSSPMLNEVVVGFNDDAEAVIDQLIRGSKQLDIVSIVGMPGLGKTTLANKVYNDPAVIYQYHIRAWCCVTQQYNRKNVLLDILDDILIEHPNQLCEMSEDDLVEKLYRCLRGNKYLIVLDDVWDIAVWNDLRIMFPNDSNGSRILFTSRFQHVAIQAKSDSKIHFLRPLSADESRELLEKKLFPKEGCPPTLQQPVMQIAKNCNGLPLTIVIVSGILATLDQDCWTEAERSLCSKIICSTEQCMTTLEHSFNCLPDHLKSCLLYCGVFHEYQEIPVWRLIRFWIAEGFVQRSDVKSLEDVGKDYIMDLIGRSLLMISKQSSRGGIKSCRMHDLLHEFCRVKAKEENFMQSLHGYNELYTFYVPRSVRRLCIYSTHDELRTSRLFCPSIRSLVVNGGGLSLSPSGSISFIFRISKLLSVLDLKEIDLGNSFPSEIELLYRLRYLAVCGTMHFIPSTIANLRNLETFLVKGRKDGFILPETIWNMKKLRHLHIRECAFIGLPTNNLESFSDLYNLDSFSTPCLSFGENMEKMMRKMPNIRRLRCMFLKSKDSTENCSRILELDFLVRLESLKVFSNDKIWHHSEFSLPLNLRKLTLSKLRMPWSEISPIAKLPNLEVLKLLHKALEGETWVMGEEEFPKLKFLKLQSLDIVRWTTSCDTFLPSLEKLFLQSCWKLEEVPSSFGDIPTLEMIQVHWCHPSVTSSVQQIQEEQMNMGNDSLKILIQERMDVMKRVQIDIKTFLI